MDRRRMLAALLALCAFFSVATWTQQYPQDEEAALSLGASGLRTFFRVTLPNVKWALLYGVLLCNARAVIGFNSMIMLESLLSPAHLIIPYWGETQQDPGVMLPSPLDERLALPPQPTSDLVAIDEALEALTKIDPRKGQDRKSVV